MFERLGVELARAVHTTAGEPEPTLGERVRIAAWGTTASDRFASSSLPSRPVPPVTSAFIGSLFYGRRHEIDGRLLDAKARLESWWRVADELAVALAEMGNQWQLGLLTIADEHVASDALARALARVGDALPLRLDGPKCLLACAGEDEHTLGLSLAELCLRELGWTPLWLGRRTPVDEVVRLVRGGQAAMVALSASALLGDEQALRAITDELGTACKERGAGLLLGGAGAWPSQPSYGVRVNSFAAFRDYLVGKGTQR